MQFRQNTRNFWGAIRWKMLIIFAFFSVASTIFIGGLSIAVLNVVIRRESAYLIEERIKTIVDNYERLTSAVADRGHTPASNSSLVTSPIWPGSQTLITVASKEATDRDTPSWLREGSFTGIVVDQGNLDIRSLHKVEGGECCSTILVRTPLGESFLKQLAKEDGL